MLRFSFVLKEALEHFYNFWDKEVKTFQKCCLMCEGLHKPKISGSMQRNRNRFGWMVLDVCILSTVWIHFYFIIKVKIHSPGALHTSAM